ncbi:M24 family metallopeptidase [Arthrobacter sp. MYb213]|uniref:M24 family metallopeptidase n=1 Tax=Arthrobacter sp. MYb213 TaxID=1848595 RepID=UPI000CFD2B27|nr:M24 family metallopeptidase [Arthrobacter sp. MYb213]PRB70075.1 peptidase M24 [Arthrobacter sp. MYb213]
MNAQPPETEQQLKHEKMVQLLDTFDADGILLSSSASLSWFLSGARTHVSLAGPPVVRVLVHREGYEVAVPISEAARVQNEELLDTPLLRVHILDWYESLDDFARWFSEVAAHRILNEAQVEPELRMLRTVLVPEEISRYRKLCQDTASIFTQVLSMATPMDSERELAARLSAAAVEIGGEVLVALVCGEERSTYRHPLPTQAHLGRRAMAVLCVRRHGLIANVTRWVRFGTASPGEILAEQSILEVEREILAALVPGTKLKSVLPVIAQAYPAHGFSATEWRNHHQGGVAGYNGRDPRLTPEVTDAIRCFQSFAWNPSALRDGQCFKVEDTMLLTEGSGKPTLEVLSVDPLWPTVRVGRLARPSVLEL